MLKIVESKITSKIEKTKHVMMIKAKGRITKNNYGECDQKWKGKGSGSRKPKKNEGKIPLNVVCFECSKKGYWKKNFSILMAKEKKEKAHGA